VDTKQELRLRFDQPMNPNVMGINWSSGGFVPDGQPRYEPARNEFVIPVRLVPGQTNETDGTIEFDRFWRVPYHKT